MNNNNTTNNPKGNRENENRVRESGSVNKAEAKNTVSAGKTGGTIAGSAGKTGGINKLLGKIGLGPLSLLAFVLLGLAPLFIDDRFIIHLMISGMIFGTLAMGFDFTVGYINIVNFGYAAIMGVGAYTSALVVSRLGMSPWLGMAIGGVMAAIMGFFIGVVTLRLRGLFAAVMAWFVGLTLLAMTANLVDLTRGWLGLRVRPLFATPDRTPYFYTIFVITIVSYIILYRLTQGKMGVAFKAIGQNQEAAHSVGVNSTKYKIINFTISCALAGVVGGFYGHFVGILTPDVMHTRETVEVLALAYIGGRGSIWGGLLAAFIIIPIFEYLRPLMAMRFVIYGLLLMLVMILYPGGLSQFFAFIKAQIFNRSSKVEERA